jgi:hypothetical protein
MASFNSWHGVKMHANEALVTDVLKGQMGSTASSWATGTHTARFPAAPMREAGLRVPEDVSVVGFDDIEFASIAYPPLTTIRQPLHEMGAMAAELLLRKLSNDESVETFASLLISLFDRRRAPRRGHAGTAQQAQSGKALGERGLSSIIRSRMPIIRSMISRSDSIESWESL